MAHVVISTLVHKRVLTARESVKAVVPELIDRLARNGESVELDFAGIEGVAPAVLDQLLISVEHVAGKRDICLLNMPDPITRKHQALARAHNRLLAIHGDGVWRFSPA